VRIRIVLALLSAAFLAACSGGTPAPAGWKPVPGASPDTQWSTGSGLGLQTYGYRKMPFAGTLQELASQQAAAVAGPGTRFESSDIFAPCPGRAAVATFSAPGARTLLRGLAVRSGTAVLVTYERPAAMPMDPEVAKALEKALCG
jgi:hypothetical protein